jgi:hypothetical protein
MEPCNTDPIAEHQQTLTRAFNALLVAEDVARAAQKDIEREKTRAQLIANEVEAKVCEARAALEQLMAETGEVEIILPGKVNDYKIGYSTPRESVKVETPSAVPEEFCKLELKPKLKEIGEHLKALRDAGKPLPNWASLEKGTPKLQWTSVKKSGKSEVA